MLETEIKRLTAAIELLTAALDNRQPAQEPAAVEPEQEPDQEPVFKSEMYAAATITNIDRPSANVDGLQSRCLELTRIDRSNSAKIKELVASYGVKLLKDIPANLLGEFAAKLEELA